MIAPTGACLKGIYKRLPLAKTFAAKEAVRATEMVKKPDMDLGVWMHNGSSEVTNGQDWVR